MFQCSLVSTYCLHRLLIADHLRCNYFANIPGFHPPVCRLDWFIPEHPAPVDADITHPVLPVVIRILVQRQGLLTQTAVERTIQRFYFASLFVQIFLTVSLSSSATTILGEMYHQLDSVPAILATNLPKTSNYFFSYLLLQSLSISASQLVQTMGLIKWLLLAPATDRTARDIWSRRHTAPVEMQWGTLFPVFTNLACIGSFCKLSITKLGY